MADKTAFLKQFDHIPANFPLQAEARGIIHNGLDFPTTQDENWKYTRIAKIINSTYADNLAIDSMGIVNTIPDLDAYRVVFINGVYSSTHSNLVGVNGVRFFSMTASSGLNRDLILNYLGKSVDLKNQAFSALNTAYFKDGAFIFIEKNTQLEKPVLIINVASGSQQVTNTRNVIVVGQNAKANFVQHFVGNENGQSFTNSVSEVYAEEGANGHLYLLQDEGAESTQVNLTQVTQMKHSNFGVFTITLSGALVRNNLNFSITDQGCESHLNGLYFTSGKQHIDNHTFADHQQPNCNSNELYKGVMTDQSTGVFNGKIMVHKHAQQTNAFQSNQNILLTDRATINTKPELEIYADDVKCSHGCTIGQLDEEAMFYLQSRGIGKEASTKLLLQAFAADVLDQIEVDAVKDYLERFIESTFQ